MDKKLVSMKEFREWKKFVNPIREEIKSRWPECEGCQGNHCECCVWPLVDMPLDDSGEFIDRVVKFVQNAVEELYVHLDWTEDENKEYGIEVGYLVQIYCKYLVWKSIHVNNLDYIQVAIKYDLDPDKVWDINYEYDNWFIIFSIKRIEQIRLIEWFLEKWNNLESDYEEYFKTGFNDADAYYGRNVEHFIDACERGIDKA